MEPGSQFQIPQPGRELPERALLRAVQEVVADDVFRGIPLGPVLGSGFITTAWHGGLTTNAPDRLSAVARNLYTLSGLGIYRSARARRSNPPADLPRGRILIEAVSSQPKMKSFWEPVATKIGTEGCILVARHGEARLQLPPAFASVGLGDAPIDWGDCRRWIMARLGRWSRALKDVGRRLGLAAVAHHVLLDMLMAQVVRLAQSQSMGEWLRPRAFLSTWDQGFLGAPLCVALRAQGVPTFTLMHGAVGRQTMAYYVPLNAEYVLVWGEIQRALFQDAGVEDRRIVVTGYPRFSPRGSPDERDRLDALQRLGLAGEGPLIVVAFTVLQPHERATWLSTVKGLVDALPEARFLCRLHPSSKARDFAEPLAGVERLRLVEASNLSLEMTMAVADAIVVDSSTFGFDALLHGKIVAVLDPYDVPKRQEVMWEAMQAGAALYSRDAVHLAARLRKVWADTEDRESLQDRARAFVTRYVSASGDQSAQQIVDCLQQHAAPQADGALGCSQLGGDRPVAVLQAAARLETVSAGRDASLTERAVPDAGNSQHRAVDLSIVIVSWNVADLLADCIESILDSGTDHSVQIIVVDNNSGDHTLSLINDRFPSVQMIANRENVGFARANNQGLEVAQGRLVLFLNPDTILRKGALQRMVDSLDAHPGAGMVGPRLEYPDGRVQAACARRMDTLLSHFFDALKLRKLPLISKLVRTPYDYGVSQEVEAISGAAMLVRAEAVRGLGGFGDEFVHVGEDLDLCVRFRRAGWKIYYVHDAIVIHLHGKSSEQAPIWAWANGVRSKEKYYARCFGATQGLIFRLIVQWIQIPIMLIVGIVKVLLRRESPSAFRQRWAIARAVWRWRETPARPGAGS